MAYLLCISSFSFDNTLINIALKIAHRLYVINEYNDHPAKTMAVNMDAYRG